MYHQASVYSLLACVSMVYHSILSCFYVVPCYCWLTWLGG
uniref:Uncharacterized protein n=1 Tax=Arundo donax TaxID=35708 RepID=A0A0A8Z7N2_ARUDO